MHNFKAYNIKRVFIKVLGINMRRYIKFLCLTI